MQWYWWALILVLVLALVGGVFYQNAGTGSFLYELK